MNTVPTTTPTDDVSCPEGCPISWCRIDMVRHQQDGAGHTSKDFTIFDSSPITLTVSLWQDLDEPHFHVVLEAEDDRSENSYLNTGADYDRVARDLEVAATTIRRLGRVRESADDILDALSSIEGAA